MAKKNLLTVKRVAELTEPGKYPDGSGLYLQISKWKTRSWLFRYTLHGRAHWMGLGSLDTFTLSQARGRALKQRQLLTDGIDPIEARRATQQAGQLKIARSIAFREAAQRYIKMKRADWTNEKHARQWQSSLETHVFPILGDFPVSEIDEGLITKTLEPIWLRIPETARRVLGRIESILDWSTVLKYRSGDNPARWKGNLEHVLPKKKNITKVQHFEAMPYPELPGFMVELRDVDGVAARALELTILCATRTGETLHANWDEIDFAAKVWTIPAERTKANREQRIPLPPRALEILYNLPSDGDLLFPGMRANKPLADGGMLLLLRAQRGAGLTVHGFRSAFRDWAAERTNHAREICEAALGHSLQDKTEAAYQRGDLLEKRKLLMSEWDAYLARPIGDGKVVSLRKTNQ